MTHSENLQETLTIGTPSAPQSATMTYYSVQMDQKSCELAEAGVAEEWNVGDLILELYEVVDILGVGAYGKVYRVHHRGWNMDLAVKSLKSELTKDKIHRKIFMLECEGWVNLGLHPNIVTCYYVRDLGGNLRIFSEFMEGGSLEEHINRGENFSLKEIINMAIQCLDGLSFAHKKGLIHRDIKPANCLTGLSGEVKITDFGIASGLAGLLLSVTGEKRLSTKTLVMEEGAAGTPAYMPPEQWDRKYGEIGPWSDIYSLSVMLFELCCGERPFDTAGEDAEILRVRHITADPPDIKDLKKDFPDSLAGFIMKCLAKKPEDRYRDCESAREELVAIYREVTGRDYHRDSPGEMELMVDGLNNRAVSLMDMGKHDEALAIWDKALASDPQHLHSIYNRGLVLWRKAKLTDEDLVYRLKEIQAGRNSTWEGKYFSALIHMERGDEEEARKLLGGMGRRVKPIIDSAVANIRKGYKQLRNINTEVQVRDIIIIPSAYIPYSSKDTKLSLKCIIAVENPGGDFFITDLNYIGDFKDELKKRCKKSGSKGKINTIALASNGKSLLIAGEDKKIYIWDLITFKSVTYSNIHKYPINAIAVTSQVRFAVSGSEDSLVIIWNLPESGRKVNKSILRGHSGSVKCVAITPDNNFLISGSSDKTLRLWDFSGRQCLKIYKGHKDTVTGVSITPDGSYMISSSTDETLLFWQLATGKILRTFRGHRDCVNSVAITPCGNFAISGSDDKTIRIWNISTGQCVRTLEGHTGFVKSLRISPDGKKMISISSDKKLFIWELEKNIYLAPLMVVHPKKSEELLDNRKNFMEALEKVSMAVEKKDWKNAVFSLVMARNVPGYERALEALSLWRELSLIAIKVKLRDIWQEFKLKGHTDDLRCFSLSPDGNYLLSGGDDKTLRLWDLKVGKCCRTISIHNKAITCNAITPDGNFAISGSLDCTISILDLSNGKCLHTLRGHEKGIKDLVITPDGKYLISACSRCLILWDIPAGQQMNSFKVYSKNMNTIALSPDGKFLIAAGRDRRIDLWDINRQKWILVMSGHGASVYKIGITPDGLNAVSASSDHTLRLWELSTGKCLNTMKGHNSCVNTFSITPDGRFIISAGDDNDIIVWKRDRGKMIRKLKGHRGAVKDLCVTPDGRFIMSRSIDKTLRIWNLSTGICIREIEVHSAGVSKILITPDSRFLISPTSGHTFVVWYLDWELFYPQDTGKWEEEIIPYLENFLINHTPYEEEFTGDSNSDEKAPEKYINKKGKPVWNEEDLEKLFYTLRCAGYGWLPDLKVKTKLHQLATEKKNFVSFTTDWLKKFFKK